MRTPSVTFRVTRERRRFRGIIACMTTCAHLFAPLTVRGVTLRNRIGVSPMCQYSSRRRLRRRLAPRPPRLARRRRRRAGLRRGDRRRAARPHLARGHRACGPTRTPSRWRASPASSPRRAPCRRSSWRTPGARPSTRPWDGDGAARRRATAAGQPVAPSADAVRRRLARRRSALDVDEHRRGRRRLSRRGACAPATAGFEWLELHARARLPASTSSSRRWPTSAPTTTAAASTNRCRFVVEVVRAVRARVARSPAARRAPVVHRLGRGRLDRRGLGRARPARSRREGVDLIDCSSRRHRRRACKIPVGARLPGAVRRARSARGGHPHRRRRHDHRADAGRRDHRATAAPTWSCSRASSCAIPTGRCTPRRSCATRRSAPPPPQYRAPTAGLPQGTRS